MRQPTVFLSYAREDTTAATRLSRELTANGRNVWFDRDCLRGGQRWRDAVNAAIRDSDFFLALLSGASVTKRGTVQAEMKVALRVLEDVPDDRIYLIPVRLTECSPSYPRLKELHWIDLFPRWEEGVAQILRSTDPDTGVPDLGPSPTPLDDLVRSMPAGPPTETPPTSLNVSEAIRESIDLFTSYAMLRNIEIRFDDRAPSVVVTAAREHLILAFSNVLSNAIKYSYAAPGRSSWVAVAAEPRGNAVRVRFESWGMGIPHQERDAIFQRGFRGAMAAQHTPLGSGIGLAAAKTVCDEYRGTIELESRPVRAHPRTGAGEPHVTVVTITLPVVSRAR
jgi:hypothetical protein